jgi:hypothetical protein
MTLPDSSVTFAYCGVYTFVLVEPVQIEEVELKRRSGESYSGRQLPAKTKDSSCGYAITSDVLGNANFGGICR